jgi:hypothetical protein
MEVSEEEYFKIKALSKSQIKNWNPYNPMAFWNKCVFNPNKVQDELGDYLITGKLYHMMLLQRELVQDNFTVSDAGGKSRDNKKWIAAQAESEKLLISTYENAQAVRMMDAISKHEIVRGLFSGGVIEKPYIWKDQEWGIDCKMKLDYIKNTKDDGLYVVDYKTTSIMGRNIDYIDKGGFQYNIGMYSRGIRAKYGQELKRFIFVFQSTNEGEEHMIRIKVVEKTHITACEIATELAVKQILPRLKTWQSASTDIMRELAWLPTIEPENWEVSPWFDRKIAESVDK